MLRNSSLLVTALVTTSLSSFAQYSVSGGGGPVPTLGTGAGTSVVNALPTASTSYPLTTPIPANASNIKSVTIEGFTHSWSGDIQAVLWNPTMTTGYNLIVRLGCIPPNGVGYAADFAGNYTVAPAGDPSINQAWPAVAPVPPLPPGVYPQYYGLGPWTSGSANVFNTDLSMIPVVPGTWTLILYDGAALDIGAITGWTLTGDTATTSTVYCSGDGTGTACPCANNGLPGNGCANSLNPGGAHLAATGASSISNDTLVLTGTGMPNSSALYFQGNAQIAAGAGAAFGDGKRCVGTGVVRLGTKTNVGGTSQYPAAGDSLIHIKGNNVAGNVRDYQCWYRNADVSFCPPATFNLSNGVELTWIP